MTETQTAEAIIENHIAIILHHRKDYNRLEAVEHAKAEVTAILKLPITWSEKDSMYAKEIGIESTEEFWQGVLEKIK